jgi:hypothetical protein
VRAASSRELRRFGLVVGGVAIALVLLKLARHHGGRPVWAIGAAGALLFLTGALAPRALRPIHAGWMWLAALLGWINTRLLLGLFFFAVLTPLALLARLFGHDPLRRRRAPAAASYWIARAAADEPDRYKRQF